MDFWLLKHLLAGESTSHMHVLKTLSLDITKPYNFLISLVKYYEILYLKGKVNLQNTTFNTDLYRS